MNTTAWPFLVSCNKVLDYMTVVAPDFVCESGAALDFAALSGGEATPEGHAYCREVQDSRAGAMTLIFRVVAATAADLGEADPRKLRDEVGRPIFLIEGVVVRSLPAGEQVTAADLDEAHASVAESFRDFWGREKWTPRASAPLAPRPGADSAAAPLTLIHQKPFGRKTPERRAAGRGAEWEAGRLDSRAHEGEAVEALAFSPEGSLLAIKRAGQPFIVWDMSTLSEVLRSNLPGVRSGHHCPFAFNPAKSSQILIGFNDPRATAHAPYTLLLWDIRENTYVPLYKFPCPIRFVLLTSSGKTVIVVDEDNVATDLGRPPVALLGTDYSHKISVRLGYRVEAVDISQDKRLRITGDDRGYVRVYDDRFDNPVFEARAHAARVTAAAFSPDNEHFVTAGADREVIVWDARSLAEVHRLTEHGLPVRSVMFNSNGRVLVTADTGGTFIVRQTRSWGVLETLRAEGVSLSSAGLSPSGKAIVAAMDRDRVQLWRHYTARRG